MSKTWKETKRCRSLVRKDGKVRYCKNKAVKGYRWCNIHLKGMEYAGKGFTRS
jgi:hypothetical protein